MDLYQRLGSELRSLFRDLFDPKKGHKVKLQLEEIIATADQIGGSLSQEAKQLQRDILHYLQSPQNAHAIAVVKSHALKLEQATREL